MDPKKRPHGTHAKGWTSPEVLEGLRLIGEGMSWRKAARQAGCTTTGMQLARKRLEGQQCQAA